MSDTSYKRNRTRSSHQVNLAIINHTKHHRTTPTNTPQSTLYGSLNGSEGTLKADLHPSYSLARPRFFSHPKVRHSGTRCQTSCATTSAENRSTACDSDRLELSRRSEFNRRQHPVHVTTFKYHYISANKGARYVGIDNKSTCHIKPKPNECNILTT